MEDWTYDPTDEPGVLDSDAYEEGVGAGECGARIDNPYRPGTAQHRAWKVGYADGWADADDDDTDDDED